jgi:signal peptidase I
VYSYYESDWYRLRRRLVIAATIVLLAIGIIGAALWRSQGIQVLSVRSGSMAPLLEAGDAVVVRKAAYAELRPGDVVSFYAPDGSQAIVTHRIVGLDKAGRPVTQGDSNAAADGPLEPSALVGRASHSVANVGYLIEGLRSPIGLALGVYVPAAFIVVVELRRLVRYFQPTYRLHRHSTAR